jgi:1,2-diacylglycerol 3-alpha-glucosyltransferase
MRVAIACCGLEHVRRGYESFSVELFNALSGHADVILFKGSGKRRPNEIVVPCLRRDFLEHFMRPQRAFYWEQLSFALALVPFLILKRIDIVHFSEGNVGNALARFVRWFRLRARLILSNGGPYHPSNFHPDLAIQQVCKAGFDLAIENGISPSRMHLIPYGIAPERYRVTAIRATVRRQFGIPVDKFTIISLAALNRSHKRIDYLIREFAALQDDSMFLCMAGEPTSESELLRKLASELLPGRHAFLTVPRARIPDLLATADLFILASLSEGFGMVLLEACAAGVPVICHNSAHFRWVLGDAGIYVDMAAPGALKSSIRELLPQRELLGRYSALGRARIDNHFSWKVLFPRYLDMYESVRNS